MITNSTTEQLANEVELDLACETLYRFLGAALSDPRRECLAVLLDPQSRELAQQAADLLRDEFQTQTIALGFGEAPAENLQFVLIREQLASRPQELGSEYMRVFGLSTCRECPPYETEYHPAGDAFFRAQQMADIAGFYRAFGVEPATSSRERPDFVGLELEFEALLLMKKREALASAYEDEAAAERAAVCQDARKAFFRDHLSWWLPSFALALRRKAEHGFYEEVGRVLAALLPIERSRLGVAPPRLPLEAQLIEPPDACEGCLGKM